MSSFKRKVKTPVLSGSESPSTPDHDSSTENAPQPKLLSTPSAMVAVAPISGAKPWIHTGLGMVSSGHRELDDIMHGGIPAGSIITHYLDTYSNYSETLMGYSMAEGLSHGHRTLVCCNDEAALETFLQCLPFNLSYDKIHSKNPAETSITSSSASNGTDAFDHGLKIAWQYEKYLGTFQLSNINIMETDMFMTQMIMH